MIYMFNLNADYDTSHRSSKNYPTQHEDTKNSSEYTQHLETLLLNQKIFMTQTAIQASLMLVVIQSICLLKIRSDLDPKTAPQKKQDDKAGQEAWSEFIPRFVVNVLLYFHFVAFVTLCFGYRIAHHASTVTRQLENLKKFHNEYQESYDF